MPPLLFLVTTITMTGITDQTILEPAGIGCAPGCTCGPDSGTYRQTVHCDKGGINSHRLGNLLGALSRGTQAIRIIGPSGDDDLARRPNQFSWSMDFGKFGKLVELQLPNNGIVGLGKGAFRRLPKLQWLDLSGNELSFVDVSTFFGATALEHLDLASNALHTGGLTSGTFRHLSSLRWLSLADNQLRDAPRGLFGEASALETLDLSGNPLSVQAIKNIVSNTPLLLHLKLDNCMLTDLPQDMFTAVSRLQRLELGRNQLGSIPTLALLPLRHLVALDVSANAITQIPEHALYGVNVHEINLAHNLLGLCYGDVSNGRQTYRTTGVDESAFWGANVSVIDLSYNKYSQFHAELLGDARGTVRILKLSGNPLKVLNAKQTSGMSLSALHMADCGLKSLPPQLPPALTDLVVLNVSGNALDSVSSDLVQQLPLLRVLDMSNNRIADVPLNTLKLVEHQMDRLLIQGNPLDCHCHVMPLQQYLRTQQMQQHQSPNQVASTRCASPAQFVGLPVTSISTPPDCALLFGASSGLTQKSELGILGALATAACLLIAIIVVFIYVARTWRRKGVYHTRELTASQTNLSSSNGSSHHDGDHPGRRSHQRQLFAPHPALLVKDGAHERLF